MAKRGGSEGKRGTSNGRNEKFLTACLRYLGLTLQEIEELDVYTFSLMMRAHNLQQEDQEYANARFAWMINRAEDTDSNGKRVYRKFKDFYDPDKRFKVLEKGRPDVRYKHLAEAGKVLNGGGE